MADRTVTIKESGGDYNSLNLALATEDDTYADLVTNTMILTFECYNFADTTAANTAAGWTTSSSYYLNIIGAASDKTSSNTGKWSTDRYRLTYSASGGTPALYNQEAYTRVTDIQIQVTCSGISANVAAFYSYGSGVSNYRFERCIAKGVVSGSNGSYYVGGFRDGTGGLVTGALFINCLAYNFVNGSESAHFGFKLDIGSANVFNCTVQNCYNGFWRPSGTVNWTNCGAAGCTTAFTGGTQTNCSSTTPTFVDEAGDDFHLASGDTTWKDAGDGSTAKATFTDDVDGDTRPATDDDWDIGFDEYVGASRRWLLGAH